MGSLELGGQCVSNVKSCGHGGDVHTMFGTVYAW